MEFSIKSSAPERLKSGAVVIGVFENGTSARLSAAGAALDRAAGGALAALIRQGDVSGKTGSTLLLPRMPRLGARVLLVGLGREAEFSDRRFREAIATAARLLDKTGIEDAALTLSAPIKGRDITWRAQHAVLAASEAVYRFDRMKSKRETRRGLKHITLCVERGEVARAQTGVTRGAAIAKGVTLARDLGNLPGNVCTPTYLAGQARALAKTYKLKAQVLERRDMERLGMGSLLAVARGSAEPPKLIVLEYHGGKRGQKPVVLVGKGVTFDSGGISIKPAAEMDEMKYDMCGAASVLGALKAAAELKLPLNIVGVIPSTENMPGSRATKPGDIATTMSGQTVEILNTDAEGRLILCDALTYAERFQPQAVVDIATLTGACVIALGHVVSGLFSADDVLAEQLLRAGDAGYDRAWRMPVWDDYQELLHSNFADFANIGGRAGGAITAACFLARFTRKYPWAHLDIAGTAWKSGREKGGTGRPVPLLVQFLIERAGKA